MKLRTAAAFVTAIFLPAFIACQNRTDQKKSGGTPGTSGYQQGQGSQGTQNPSNPNPKEPGTSGGEGTGGEPGVQPAPEGGGTGGGASGPSGSSNPGGGSSSSGGASGASGPSGGGGSRVKAHPIAFYPQGGGEEGTTGSSGQDQGQKPPEQKAPEQKGSEQTAQPSKPAEQFATVQIQGLTDPNVSGTANFEKHGKTAGKLSMSLDGLKQGSYVVQVVQGSDCSQLGTTGGGSDVDKNKDQGKDQKKEDPGATPDTSGSAGAPDTTGGTAKSPSTAAAPSATPKPITLGHVSVGSTGHGRFTSNISSKTTAGLEDTTNPHLLIIRESSSKAATGGASEAAPVSPPIACGAVVQVKAENPSAPAE